MYNGLTANGIPGERDFSFSLQLRETPGQLHFAPSAPARNPAVPALSHMTDLIAGRYELRARISKGGMGAVWSARDRRLRRDVAVKLLHAWIADDLELRRRFAREARVLAPLEHENIVRLYDYGEDGETPFLVMELVEGANLGDVARNRTLHLGAGCRDRAADRVRARLRACARDRRTATSLRATS